MAQNEAQLRAEIHRLRTALSTIAGIQNEPVGPDWAEIEEAREVATKALGAPAASFRPVPTTYMERFRGALALLAGGMLPSEELCQKWLFKVEDSKSDLQEWAAFNVVLPWAQGIGAIDAARLLADQPEEGVEHQMFEDAFPELVVHSQEPEAAFLPASAVPEEDVEAVLAGAAREDAIALESNVRYLVDQCPFTVRDLSGERTGMRGVEDLTGSLAITFLGMQNRLKEMGKLNLSGTSSAGGAISLVQPPVSATQVVRDDASQAKQVRWEFQNFHRGLCERFGYVHDPIHWARDQVSLEEHIAGLISPAGGAPSGRSASLVAA